MNIACLGWGSLVWRPGDLLIRREWFVDGPLLPIEFARQSADGRLTLVITDTAQYVRTMWALMNTQDINQARNSLLLREGIPQQRLKTSIGSVTRTEINTNNTHLIIQNWAKTLALDAVVWTNLPPKFHDTNGDVPTIEEAIGHFNQLDIQQRAVAEEYVRRTPKQIDTTYRRRFEIEFGWTARD